MCSVKFSLPHFSTRIAFNQSDMSVDAAAKHDDDHSRDQKVYASRNRKDKQGFNDVTSELSRLTL